MTNDSINVNAFEDAEYDEDARIMRGLFEA